MSADFVPVQGWPFAGQASPFELGFGRGRENVRGGSYVSSERIQIEGAEEEPPQRWYCWVGANHAEWWAVHDSWRPPAIP